MPDTTLFQSEKPDIYLRSQIYDPTNNPTGNVIPKVGDLVQDVENDQGVLYYVRAVDPVTHASTLAQETIIAVSPEDGGSLTSVVSYKNDIFRIYYDSRVSPWAVQPDDHSIVYGIDNANYRIIRYPDTPNEVSIALEFDSSGNFVGDRVPLQPVNPGSPGAGSYFSPSNTSAVLTDGERLRLEVYNSYGALTAEIYGFAKQSTIQNEGVGRQPVITALVIGSSQLRSNNEIYIYERQDPSSLAITATLQFDDGTSLQVPIDGSRCKLFNLAGFEASYAGLQQTIMVKYFLVQGQNASADLLLSGGANSISAEATLVVVPNELASPVKVAVIPKWSSLTSQYVLSYFLYSVDGLSVTPVTQWVTISEGSFAGAAYGEVQDFTILLDLHNVDPITYPTPTPYQQEVIITLQPQAILQRYLIRDASNSQYVYGADAPNNRRPVLNYDTTRQQYFVPSTLFPTSAAFLFGFYNEASPPYDPTTATTPPVPTHFYVRDPVTGLGLVAAPIPVANWSAPFNITGSGSPDRYSTTNVLFEFLQVVNGTTHILFGASVDCYVSQTGYLGS